MAYISDGREGGKEGEEEEEEKRTSFKHIRRERWCLKNNRARGEKQGGREREWERLVGRGRRLGQ